MTDLLSLGEDAWDDSALIEAFEREVADYEAFHFGDKRPRKQKKKTSKKQVSKVTPASVPISTQQEEKTAELKSARALEPTVESACAHDVSVGSKSGDKSNKKPQDDVAQTSSQQANSYPSAPPPTNPQTLPDANQHIPGIQHYSQPHPTNILPGYSITHSHIPNHRTLNHIHSTFPEFHRTHSHVPNISPGSHRTRNHINNKFPGSHRTGNRIPTSRHRIRLTTSIRMRLLRIPRTRHIRICLRRILLIRRLSIPCIQVLTQPTRP
eukprot:856619_1